MIKEIMLASAVLTNSINSDIYFNLENLSNTIHIAVNHSFYENKYGDYAIVYNLSNGNYDIVTYVIDNDGYTDLYEINIRDSYSSWPVYISDYFIYNGVDKLGFMNGVPNLLNYAYAEWLTTFHFEGISFYDSDNEDANLSYHLCVKDSRNNLLMPIADKDSISLYGSSHGDSYSDNESVLFGESYISLYNLLSGSFSVSTSPEDYVLLFQLHELAYVESSTLIFDFINLFNSFDFGYELLNGYSDGYNDCWTDLFYSNVANYEEIVERNNSLIAENNRLNSEHVFSNIFELVRGAINGVVDFMSIEIMPNLTIGSLFFIPVVIGVIWFILKALVL